MVVEAEDIVAAGEAVGVVAAAGRWARPPEAPLPLQVLPG